MTDYISIVNLKNRYMGPEMISGYVIFEEILAFTGVRHIVSSMRLIVQTQM